MAAIQIGSIIIGMVAAEITDAEIKEDVRGMIYFLLFLNLCVAIEIYQDAKKRNYKHVWTVTIIGLLFSLIGYGIWLIIRRKYPKIKDADNMKFNTLESLGLANTWSIDPIKFFLIAVVFAVILTLFILSAQNP